MVRRDDGGSNANFHSAVSHGLPTAVVAVEVHGHKDARPGMTEAMDWFMGKSIGKPLVFIHPI